MANIKIDLQCGHEFRDLHRTAGRCRECGSPVDQRWLALVDMMVELTSPLKGDVALLVGGWSAGPTQACRGMAAPITCGRQSLSAWWQTRGRKPGSGGAAQPTFGWNNGGGAPITRTRPRREHP